MEIGSIFLILALFVLVVLFIGRPFLERRIAAQSVLSSSEDHELSSLMAERDRILNALQELDFDFALGKIPEEDYPGQRAMLLQRGADVLRRLDTLQPSLKADSAETWIEAAIAARRADAARSNGAEQKARARQVAQVASPDDQLESLLANRRRQRQGAMAGFCPQCGGPVQKTDRFCPKCGATLA